MYNNYTMYVQCNTLCITMYYMKKISKTFRLSPEAVKVLEEQGNQSQYIEELITSTPKRALEVVPLQQLEAVLEEMLSGLSSKGRTVDFDSTNLGSNPSEPAKPKKSVATQRTKADVKQEIDALGVQREQGLEFVQDAAATAEIHRDYQEKIDELWREFHSL